MRTRPTLKTILLVLTLPVSFVCFTDDEPVWRDPVMVQQENGKGLKLLTPEEAEKQLKQQEKESSGPRRKPDPGWIGDCYYYADGGYYHKDGIYWRADMKTHYVYEERCWHLPNGGILTETGVYYPPIAAPDGLLGIPWRLVAVASALIAGPPQNPGTPPQKPTRVVIEVRSSSD